MTADGFVVREGRAEDVAGVLELERATAEAPHWGEREYRTVGSPDEGAVRRGLFVAEGGGRLLGFAVGRVAAGEGELESVAVAASARRRGVGRALCEAVVAWCREGGAARVDLEVRAGSEAAFALYQGLGFRASGRRTGYYTAPVEDAVLMRLHV